MAFMPRLTDSGILNDYKWYGSNPFYLAGYGMPNCTCYAWGRRYEITGKPPGTSLGNGRTWYEYAVSAGQSVGQTARLGAIACFTDSRAEAPGHVGIVEQISGGEITTSNSNYGGEYFVIWSVAEILAANPTFVLQGYIYLDSEEPEYPVRKFNKKIIYQRPLWRMI